VEGEAVWIEEVGGVKGEGRVPLLACHCQYWTGEGGSPSNTVGAGVCV